MASPSKLLHVLVALGAGMTGGLVACGGAIDDPSRAADAQRDSSSVGYGRISIDSSVLRPGASKPPADAGVPDLDPSDADVGDAEPGDAG